MADKLTGVLSAQPTLSGSLSASQGLSASLSTDIVIKMQYKEISPSADEQYITADDGFAGLNAVKVGAIPQNYGHIVFNGSYLLVE